MSNIQDKGGIIRTRLVYDPSVKGYDQSFFKTISGTPSISGGNIRLNTAAITSYSQYLYGDFHFKANVATTPSAGEAKHWGLRHPATNIGSMFFDITAAVFSFKSYNEDNTVTSTTVTWNQQGQTWNGSMTDFRILWTDEEIKAYVSGILVATHKIGDNNTPVPLTISNADADNMDVDYIIANKIGNLTT